MPTTDTMTGAQDRCWRALRTYHRQFGTAPTFGALGGMLGVSRQRAHQLAAELKRAGLLGRDGHGRLVPHDLADAAAAGGR
jgi:DNA-binding IclR family transcriptional regulator